jgi:flagellar basal body-associated protein FliL
MGTAGTEEEISGTMLDTFSKRDTLLGKVTGPVLALVTVLLTFAMFFYFVWVSSTSSPEVKVLNSCMRDLAVAQQQLDSLKSPIKNPEAKPATANVVQKDSEDELRNKLAHSKILCDYAKAALDTVKERQATMKEIMLYVLGVLSSALTTILGYYFGSSKGSSEKNHALNAIATKIEK